MVWIYKLGSQAQKRNKCTQGRKKSKRRFGSSHSWKQVLSRLWNTEGVGWSCITVNLRLWTRCTQETRELGIPWGSAQQACQCMCFQPFKQLLLFWRSKGGKNPKPQFPSKILTIVNDAGLTAWIRDVWGLVTVQGILQEIFGWELENHLKLLPSTTQRNQIHQSLTLLLHSPHLIYTLTNDDY